MSKAEKSAYVLNGIERPRGQANKEGIIGEQGKKMVEGILVIDLAGFLYALRRPLAKLL